MDKIQLPKFIQDYYKSKDPDLKDQTLDELKDVFVQNMIGITPSFFKLLNYLEKKKKNYRIVFRTFGADISKVQKELNIYYKGRHPLYKRSKINPKHMKLDLQLKDDNIYSVVRINN